MKKSISFFNLKDKKRLANYRYTTFRSHVQVGKIQECVIYTYPVDENLIRNGELITPFYYTDSRFTTPLFKRINLVREFFDIFDSLDNSAGIINGTPSFSTEPTYIDPLTIYICRYGEILPDLTPGVLTDKLLSEIGNKGIEINYEIVKERLTKMKADGVIFHKNMLWLKPLYYQRLLVKIKTNKIYQIIGGFNKFNMLTQLALTEKENEYYLSIEYPCYQFSGVVEILNILNLNFKTYLLFGDIEMNPINASWSFGNNTKAKINE